MALESRELISFRTSFLLATTKYDLELRIHAELKKNKINEIWWTDIVIKFSHGLQTEDSLLVEEE
jgi:hypothetical protein